MEDSDCTRVPIVVPEASKCVYTACYCEENVWKLASFVKENCTGDELAKCYCIFISNESRKIPLWRQKASRNAERLVIWDYHVVLVYGESEQSLVYDLDTELTFPCTLQEYATVCIGEEKTLKEEYRRMFRVIPADEFITTFASDRSHMINEKGEWMAPPPKYAPICCKGVTNNIEDFISMSPSSSHGQVLDFDAFLKRFHVKR